MTIILKLNQFVQFIQSRGKVLDLTRICSNTFTSSRRYCRLCSFFQRTFLKVLALQMVIAIALAGCTPQSENYVENDSSSSPSVIPLTQRYYEDEREHMNSVSEENEALTLNQARLKMEGDYQVKPDSRFLRAIADVNMLITGSNKKPVIVAYRSSKWQLSYDGKVVGLVSQFPDFTELYELLVNYAQTLNLKEKTEFNRSEMTLTDIDENDCLNTAINYESRWRMGERSFQVLKASSNALTELVVQQLDLLEVGDELPAQALAMNALANAFSREQNVRNRSLLAYVLGYRHDAKAIAALLPPDDAVRKFIVADLTISTTKKPKQITRLGRFLGLSAHENDKGQWLKFFHENYSNESAPNLAILKSYLRVGQLSRSATTVPISLAILASVLAEIQYKHASLPHLGNMAWTPGNTAEAERWMVGSLLGDFDQNLNDYKIDQHVFGSKDFIGTDIGSATYARVNKTIKEDIVAPYYRGYFFTSVNLLLQSFLELPSARPDCQKFVNSLDGHSSQQAREFQTCLKNLVAIKTGELAFDQLPEQSVNLLTLGAPALLQLFVGPPSTKLVSNPKQWFLLGRILLLRMDSRAPDRLLISKFVKNTLFYVEVAESLKSSAIKSGISVEPHHFWWLQTAGSVPESLALAGNNHLSAIVRIELIEHVEVQKLASKSWIRNAYRQLANEKLESWPAHLAYANFLIRNSDFVEARKAVVQFMRHKFETDAEQSEAVAKLAEISLRQNELDRGLSETRLAKIKNSFQVLRIKTLLLSAAHRNTEAKWWAEGLFERYPENFDATLLLLDVLWKNQQFEEAATRVAANQTIILGPDHLVAFGKQFLDSLDDKTARMALQSFQKNGHCSANFLSQLSWILHRFGRPDFAFEALMLVPTMASGQVDKVSCAYGYLKQAQGEKSALIWLKSYVSNDLEKNAFAPYAFYSGNFELLWEFIPMKPVGPLIETVWLMRAASLIGPENQKLDRRILTTQHFRQTKNSSLLGRFLADEITTKAFLNSPMNRQEICQNSFFVAWKLLRQAGKVTDENAFLRLSVETGETDLPEFDWASSWLSQMINSMSFDAKIERVELVINTHQTRNYKAGDWTHSNYAFTEVKN